MTIGKLYTNIVFDDPGKIHYGPSDPVTGHVEIKWSPALDNPQLELFGPLKVFVTLQGRAKTKIHKSNGQTRTTHRGRAPLFCHKTLIYDDSFRAQRDDKARIPFSLLFPETVESTFVDDFSLDRSFDCDPRQTLPPSFNSSNHGFARSYNAFVEYSVESDVCMPQLKVEVIDSSKLVTSVVRYERPRLLQQPANQDVIHLRGYESVRNELLLPEADRPSGFRQKTKALLGAGHFPTYGFDWECVVPKDVYLGQPVRVQVRIKPREDQCTAPLVPDVWLRFFMCELVAHTRVQASTVLFAGLQAGSSHVECRSGSAVGSKEPFSKAADYTKTFNMALFGGVQRGALASSFKTFNISHTHVIKLRFSFELTDCVKRIDEQCSVTLHPPLESADTVAGPSSSSQPPDPEAELPQYDPAPPSYEQARLSSDMESM